MRLASGHWFSSIGSKENVFNFVVVVPENTSFNLPLLFSFDLFQ